MSAVAARRMLIEAAQKLAKTNAPTLEHYEAMLDAIATVYKYDTGTECKAVLVQEKVLQ